jgi:serine/threonine-protein kinase
MIGRLIDGRYQVRSRIARGGMATVYLATDLRLERRVALKVMHGHLADDAQFRERFIQEARSAARLAHPNVVNVFDQGQDSDMAYLVMEYLPGITLRDLLQEHRILTTEQTLDIMEAVLGGLAAAHKAGIVHRDLKPENVLLADDGRIKIGDFGLARAVSNNTATGAALLGTIAYLSPELVTRGVADARSDIYAVGIMMYEMLVGEQPFKGDQPMQIAYQHANDTVPTPSSKNPRVPAELDELVAWATAREPDQRPRDARAMLDQLFETHNQLQTALPTTTGSQRTMVLPSAVAPAAATPAGDNAETMVLGPRRNLESTAGEVSANTSALALKSGKRRARGWWLFAVIILVAALAGGTGWYFGAGPGSKTYIPESLAGMSVEEATATLQELGFTVSAERGETSDPTIAVGLVANTDPAIGQSVARGTTVTLLVSTGPKPIAVPPFAGMTEDEANAAISAAPFTATDPVRQFDAAIPAGTVIDALAADGSSLTGVTTYGELQPVTLVVSAGALPDVAGLSVEDATNKLNQVGLVAGAINAADFSDTVPEGAVVRIQPRDDKTVVRVGDTVDLITSKGIEQVAVPDVVGLSWDEAKPILEAAGFDLDYNIFADSAPSLFTVSKVKPDAGTLVDKGSTVKINFSS